MERTFARVIDLANERRAHLLLIAGDFFDNDRVPAETVTFAAEQIARFEGHTILLPGNHDPMDAGSIYWRHDMAAIAPRLHIIREPAGETVQPPGLDVVLWGRGYLDSDWHFRPLDGLPERRCGCWHIALAHGHVVRNGGDLNRSMLIRQEEFEAHAANWDYFALGHWEPHADVSSGSAVAVYSGAPMALSDANRRAGLAIVADFEERGVAWEAVRVDPRPPLD
jgi:DNA repair exonuclease SbcCD nuclease subunit